MTTKKTKSKMFNDTVWFLSKDKAVEAKVVTALDEDRYIRVAVEKRSGTTYENKAQHKIFASKAELERAIQYGRKVFCVSNETTDSPKIEEALYYPHNDVFRLTKGQTFDRYRSHTYFPTKETARDWLSLCLNKRYARAVDSLVEHRKQLNETERRVDQLQNLANKLDVKLTGRAK